MKQWKREFENSIKGITTLKRLVKLKSKEETELLKVTKIFPMQVTPYYLRLIKWKKPSDPIKRVIIPDLEEVKESGKLDPGNEKKITVCKGVEHKYSNTALFLVSDTCASYCRFCFRKRLHVDKPSANQHSIDIIENKEELRNGLDYIKKHKEIDNVLLSGGDPLTLKNSWVDTILAGLRKIKHIKIIRIGTRVPCYLPSRITKDPDLLNIIAKHNRPEGRIHFIVHFEHPNELTKQSRAALETLVDEGIITKNQAVMLKDVNDSPLVIRKLFNELACIGVPPYYLFQCRPVISSMHFWVPLEKGYRIFEEAKKEMSGLAKSCKYVMSHSTGKIEICGIKDDKIYLKYHEAKNKNNIGKFFSMKLKKNAYWFDDLIN